MDEQQPIDLNNPQPHASALSQPAEAPRPGRQSPFIAPDGLLRPGWRFLIYLVAFFAVLLAISFVIKPLLHHNPHQRPRIWVYLVGELEIFLAAVIPALFFARYENRPFGAYGLPRRGAFGRNFWFGLLWGICAITLLLVVMRGAHIFYFGGLAEHGIHILKFGVFWAVLFLTVGFAEEFLTRGYTQFTLAKAVGFWPAAFLLSFTFGALHFPQEYKLGDTWGAVAGALGAVCIALFFCFTLRRTGSLWFAIGMHASWDWGESFLYSVPDSGTLTPGHLLTSSFHGRAWLTGGPVGPEASVLVFVLIAVMWVIFDRIYPARNTLTSVN
jgi:uncharacterized protein